MKRNALVLLAAADALTRRLTANGLEMYGYEVVVVGTSNEAIDLLRTERRIGLLVTDVELGGEVDGLAVAQVARQVDPRMMVIYTSRFPQAVVPDRRVSAAPTLRSPYHPQQVIGLIAQLRQAGGSEAAEAA